MIEIILLESRKQENIGSVARAMKNFDFGNLVLINPKCKIGVKANKIAKHGKNILKKTKIKKFSYLKTFDYLIGTTAILGTDYNIPRLAEVFAVIEGVVFAEPNGVDTIWPPQDIDLTIAEDTYQFIFIGGWDYPGNWEIHVVDNQATVISRP